MKRFPDIFGAIVICALLLYHHDHANLEWTWIYRWVILTGLLLLFFAARIAEKVSLFPGVAFLYFSLTGLIYATTSVWANAHPRIQQALHLSAAYSTLIVCLVPMFLLARSTKWKKRFFKTTLMTWLRLAAWGIALCALTVTDIYSKGIPILHNPSIAGTFMAILLVGMDCPFAWMIFLFGLFLLKASTPFAALFVGLLVRFIVKGGRRLKWVFASIPPMVGGLAWFAYPKLQDGNGRFPAWRAAFHWFKWENWHAPLVHHWPQAHWAFGWGLGSYPVLGPLAQIDSGVDPLHSELHLYIHNDWAQILLESGLFGLVLAVLLISGALYRSRYDAKWAGMIGAYCGAMLTNFPMRLPILAFTGIVLLGGAYLED